MADILAYVIGTLVGSLPERESRWYPLAIAGVVVLAAMAVGVLVTLIWRMVSE